MKKRESDLLYNATSDDEDFLLNEFEYSEFLEEEKDIKMDLSFEDFLEKVENRSENKPVKKVHFLKFLSGIAACSLFGLGIFYSLHHSEEFTTNRTIINHPLEIENLSEVSDETEKFVNYVKEAGRQVEGNASAKKSTQNNEQIVTDSSIETEQEIVNEEIDLVTINGENINDKAVAEEITLNTLKLLASNLSIGGEAVSNLKHLSIEL